MKYLKRIIAFVLIALTAVNLTSCLALDRAKAHHMKYGDDNETIVFRGTEYKKLPSTRAAFRSNYLSSEERYNLTASDVPVLLSGTFGTEADYDGEFDVITTYGIAVADDSLFPGGRFDYNGTVAFFATAEHYDEYAETLRSPRFTTLAVVEPEIDTDSGKYRETFVALKGAFAKELTALIESAKPCSDEELDRIMSDGYHMINIYRTTDDLFAVDSEVYAVYETADGFYLTTDDAAVKLDKGTVKELGIVGIYD